VKNYHAQRFAEAKNLRTERLAAEAKIDKILGRGRIASDAFGFSSRPVNGSYPLRSGTPSEARKRQAAK
jgi:hypothetical protein